MFRASNSAMVRALLCSSALVIAAPAFAQDAPADPQASAAEPQAQSGLREIIVTGRKQRENLQSIPIAETVVSKAQIDHFDVNSVEKMSTLAPQLIVGRNGSGNGAAIGLRGISVNATSISLEQSVAVVVDSVYYSGGRTLNMGMFDLSQAELLKGPQSLFYGKNTTAGALSFTTADPTKDFEGMARVGYEFNAHNPYVEGFISGPVSDTLSLRLAGRYSKQYGALIDNVSVAGTTYTRDIATGTVTSHVRPAPDSGNTPGERNFTTRFTAKWDPAAGLTATIKATYNDYHSNTPNSSGVVGVCEATGHVQTDVTAPCGHVFTQIQSALPRDIVSTLHYAGRDPSGSPFLDYKAFNVTGNIQYDAGKVSLTLTPAYTTYVDYWNGDFDFTDNYLTRASTLGTSGNNASTREQQRTFSLEARARTHFTGIFNVMAGGYYQDNDLYFGQENVFPGGAENSAAPDPSYRYLTVRKDSHTFGKTYATFGQVLVDITPQLNITAGVRYTHETKDSVQSQPYVISTAAGSFAQKTFVIPQAFDNTSPEATITWKPSHQLTIYGSYRTGYKSGGYSISGTIAPSSTAADAAFGPEKVKGFEGGVKSTLADNQLRVNADVFSYNYTGLQADFFNPLTIQYLTVNAAKARSRGAELEVEFAPRSVAGLNLRGSLAYTDAIYTSFPLAPCVGGQSRAEGCSLAINGAGNGTRQNLSGAATPQAPKWAGTLGSEYSTPVSDAMKIGFSSNLRYSSRYKTYSFAPDAAKRFYQESYATIDASVRLSNENDRWELALIGKNLTNHFIQSSAFDLTYTGSGAGTLAGVHSDTRSSIYDPRTVAVQATVRF
jgi:iron complex outermembrane recepter protein